MGVVGLWQLLNPVGQPVTLESLENKILTVDISIWLNQAVKGYRDAKGGAVTNAHLLSLFNRLCKLLFYKIRPIIVFDGGVPDLKKNTIISRQQKRSALKESSKDAALKLLTNYITAQNLNKKSDGKIPVTSFLANKPTVKDDIFLLPPLESNLDSNDDECEEIDFRHDVSSKDLNYLNKIDIESEDFNVLPVEIKQEILSTLKENRKHKRWEYYEALPKESAEFSSYQMQCLLKRRKLQSKLEEIQKDVRQSQSLDILSLYSDNHEMIGEPSKIMSDDCSHYVLLKRNLKHKENEVVEPDIDEPSENHNFDKDVNTINNDCTSIMKSTSENEIKFTAENEMKFADENETTLIKENENYLIYSGEENKFVKTEVSFDSEICVKSVSDNCDPSTSFESISQMPSTSCNTNKSKDYKRSLFHSSTELKQNCTSRMFEQTNKNQSISSSSSDCESFDIVPELEHEVFEEHQPILIKECQSPVINLIQQKDCVDSNDKIDNDMKKITEHKDIIEVTTNVNIRENTTEDDIEIIAHDTGTTKLSFANENNKSSDLTLQNEILQIQTAVQEIEESSLVLQAQQAKVERQATTVQEHMIEDCKDLLRLFGVPYIVSPKEAEAQCAFYDLHDISHGTITDDSDIWLFGGKRVYKNFFAQKKYVEFYKDSEIQAHFGLNRNKLINFALLTGSDYTEGIEGVGPVTAMEIISEFGDDGIDALKDFKKWWDNINKHASPPKNKVCSKLRKLPLTASFPSQIIFNAYLQPEINCSMESFSWGCPDLDSLRDYCRQKFGWNKSKVDEAVLPIIKRLNERTSQLHLDSFFKKVNLKKEKKLFPSKRIMSALKKINPDSNCDEPDNSPKETKRKTRNKTITKKTIKSTSKRKTKEVQLSEESSSDSN